MVGMRVTYRRQAAAEAAPGRLDLPVAQPLLLGFQLQSACFIEGSL